MASILFQRAGDDGSKTGVCAGCLTQVRQSFRYQNLGLFAETAETPELTVAIQTDERLPAFPDEIKIEHLPIFAEWMRRLKADPATSQYIV